ncbi:MAG: hypothetical protein R3F19_04260 [Verrucomicrobiales bacterium]
MRRRDKWISEQRKNCKAVPYFSAVSLQWLHRHHFRRGWDCLAKFTYVVDSQKSAYQIEPSRSRKSRRGSVLSTFKDSF